MDKRKVKVKVEAKPQFSESEHAEMEANPLGMRVAMGLTKPQPMSDARLKQEVLNEIDRLRAEVAAKDAEIAQSLSVGRVMVWEVGTLNGESVTVERVSADGKPDRFAVRRGRICLSKSGKWDYEPMNSHRTDLFLKRHRWDSLKEAADAATAAIAGARKATP